MAARQDHISHTTPMGGTLVPGGATFRTWAPKAREVYVLGDFNNWTRDEDALLVKQSDDRWTGFFPNATDGMKYKFFVVGEGGPGPKRDPYARELTNTWPNPDCVLRAANSYAWQDWTWRTPPFNELIVYQLHIGTFFGPNRETRPAKFLDVLDRIEYLADLGVNAIEPLPVVEYSTPRSLGYNGTDLFSPEMDYEVGAQELDSYLPRVNRLLQQKGKALVSKAVLSVPINQLKVFIDICHAYGLAVIFDAVYNHASSDLRDERKHDETIFFFDRQRRGDDNRSLYFTDQDHTGPVFAFWKEEVRQFLIDNATFFVDEYHVDGFRYDQVTVIVQQNTSDGWRFCQNLTGAVRALDASAINVAEYWGPDPAVVRPVFEGGADFDANWHDGLRRAIRGVIAQAAGGRDVAIDWQPVVDQLRAPGFRNAWRAVQYIESHDEVYRDRAPRIAALAGGGDGRSWYARSRSRVALGLLMAAPGIPMIFMGQEFLEDKRWADDPVNHPGTLIYWDGLATDKTMIDFHRFTRELLWLGRQQPALSGESVATVLMDNVARVLVVHRWIEGVGRDLIVVFSLNESTMSGYRVPFPRGGTWFEIFNSDVYDNWVNPMVAGNGGRIEANGPGLNGLSASADLVIPANAFLVFSA
jgi:1,4-alpha-glucan branching enzyme